jgi:hypothetical protein
MLRRNTFLLNYRVDFFEVCERFSLRSEVIFREVDEGRDRTKIAWVGSLVFMFRRALAGRYDGTYSRRRPPPDLQRRLR